MERRQQAIEEKLDKLDKHQDLHSRHMLFTRIQLKQNNKYMKHIHEHLIGSTKGKKGLLSRVKTLEVRQKGIISTAFMLISAVVIGFMGWFK